jgi:hypothetical protein
MSGPHLKLVGSTDEAPATGELDSLLVHLIKVRDEAEAMVRQAEALIRPLARSWADQRRQFTMPSLDQLRREL